MRDLPPWNKHLLLGPTLKIRGHILTWDLEGTNIQTLSAFPEHRELNKTTGSIAFSEEVAFEQKLEEWMRLSGTQAGRLFQEEPWQGANRGIGAFREL